MNDERTGNGPGTEPGDRDGERDVLGALIGAAGRRAPPPPDAYEEVFAAAHGAWQRKLRARIQRRWLYALAAAGAALAVGVALVVEMLPRSSPPVIAAAEIVQGDVLVQTPANPSWQPLRASNAALLPGSRLRSTVSGRVAVTLPGNTSLRVDAASELTLRTARRIELVRGTIYIDAGTDDAATEPFRVTTRLGTVRDVGTQFEVAALDDELRIRVREGAVRLEQPGSQNPFLGSAGEQLSLGTDGSLQRNEFSPFGPAWAWVETLSSAPEVEGQSLLLFLDWVARETGRALRFDAPVTETRARTVVLHGSAADLAPMQALDIMLSTTDFDYTLRNDGAILIRPRGAGP